MTEQTPSASRRTWRPFSKLSSKIMLILVALGSVSMLVGLVASMTFSSITDSMTDLTSVRLSALENSSALIEAADGTKNAMVDVLTERNAEALATAANEVEKATAALNAVVSDLPEDVRPLVEGDARNANAMLARLVGARQTQQTNQMGIAERIDVLQTRSASLQAHMIEVADEAYFDLTLGGESTISGVETTLKTLVEEQFSGLQGLLQARAEANLLAGMLYALQMTDDIGTRTLLADVTNSAEARLKSTIEQLSGNPTTRDYVPVLQEAAAFFDGLIVTNGFPRPSMQPRILETRRDLDQSLSDAIDNTVFMLTINAEEAIGNSRDAIQSLLDNEVGQINTLFSISKLINRFQVAALDLVIAPGVAEARAAAEGLNSAASELTVFEDFSDGRLREDLNALAALGDPETGLLLYKLAMLEADSMAADAAKSTSAAVYTISNVASDLASENLTAIANMAHGIRTDVAKANAQVNQLLFALGGAVLLAFVLTRWMVNRPLDRLRASTERLAEGDLAEVKGFERSSEEIFRIASALAVFRNGLLEKREMAERQEREQRLRSEQQDAAVAAIGGGLARLSRGDLSQQITADVAEGYAKLRDDFNRAQETLRDMLKDMADTSTGLQDSANQIGSASEDLSRRTENQAATLEESVAALDLVTSAVNASADSARDAENSLDAARAEAQQTGDVVRDAIGAMQQIKSGSDSISRIVGVIDDIAFQTNLLALNAGVEAARAGSSGSGFAVVAAEVRGLAHRSSESAMEIKALIDQSAAQVDEGVDLVGRAGEALTAMLDRFGAVSSMMSSIAQSAMEQSVSLKEVNSAMNNLDRVTQDNAAMVQESATATQRMTADAARMASLAARFTTDVTPRADSQAADAPKARPRHVRAA
ncbi:methyl-accepting chemotaxis protein [Tropicibacter sp. S64]|uniref:methyl-accepting chemotaxis protein n=1 Tax=Tropicibacter sp. S64 TaxID=3415122 RepID=UPI003C7CFCE8